MVEDFIKEKKTPDKTMKELESELETALKIGKGINPPRRYKKIDPRQCGCGRKIARNYPEDYFG